MLDYDQALRMAQWMKIKDPEIQSAIRKTARDQHGVVALRFSNSCTKLKVEILDEPFDDNVRVYPA